MPTMLVVPVLVLLWAAVLTPTVLAKFRERRSVEGIGAFHRSLHLLDPHGDPAAETPPALPPRRPQLVLLKPVPSVDDADDAFVDERSGACFARVPVRHAEPAWSQLDQPHAVVAAHLAAQRRKTVLLSLVSATVVFLVAGLMTSITAVLALGIVAGMLTLAYLAAAFATVRRIEQRRALGTARTWSRAEFVDEEHHDDVEVGWVRAASR